MDFKHTVWQLCLIWRNGREEGNGASFVNTDGVYSHTSRLSARRSSMLEQPLTSNIIVIAGTNNCSTTRVPVG